MSYPDERQAQGPRRAPVPSNDITIVDVQPANGDGSVQPSILVTGTCLVGLEVACEVELSAGGTSAGFPSSLVSPDGNFLFKVLNLPKIAAPNFHVVIVKPTSGTAVPDTRNITVSQP